MNILDMYGYVCMLSFAPSTELVYVRPEDSKDTIAFQQMLAGQVSLNAPKRHLDKDHPLLNGPNSNCPFLMQILDSSTLQVIASGSI